MLTYYILYRPTEAELVNNKDARVRIAMCYNVDEGNQQTERVLGFEFQSLQVFL